VQPALSHEGKKCEVRKLESNGLKGEFTAHEKEKATGGLRKLNDSEDLHFRGY
jgi:hypothetical protein